MTKRHTLPLLTRQRRLFKPGGRGGANPPGRRYLGPRWVPSAAGLAPRSRHSQVESAPPAPAAPGAAVGTPGTLNAARTAIVGRPAARTTTCALQTVRHCSSSSSSLAAAAAAIARAAETSYLRSSEHPVDSPAPKSAYPKRSDGRSATQRQRSCRHTFIFCTYCSGGGGRGGPGGAVCWNAA